jgi:hypothetical protein
MVDLMTTTMAGPSSPAWPGPPIRRLGIFRLTLRFNQVTLHCGKVGKEHLIWVHLKALVQTHTHHLLLACSPIGSEDSQRMTICLTWPSLADVPSKA